MNKFCYLSVFVLTLLAMPLVSYAHCKGKHTGNHPHCASEPPPPPPESCADAEGEFPAFAFSRANYGRGGKFWSGNDIVLANSTGTCEETIFSLDHRYSTDLKFRLNGNQGRIVWTQYGLENMGRKDPSGGVVKLLTFDVNAGEISNVSHTVAWRHAPDLGPHTLVGSDLSPDGNTVYFTFSDHSQLPDGGDVIATVRHIDITTCTSYCPHTIISSTPSTFPYWALSMNLDATRLYFVQLQGGVGFIDIATEEIRYIMKMSDFLLPNVAFERISVGYLSTWNEAIAVGYGNDRSNTLDIIDVGSCFIDGTPVTGPTCLASGFSSFVKTEIPGGMSTFDGPDLIVSDGGSLYIHSVEGTAAPALFILNGHAPDSAE